MATEKDRQKSLKLGVSAARMLIFIAGSSPDGAARWDPETPGVTCLPKNTTFVNYLPTCWGSGR